jgi:hypothetical protein
MQRTIVPTYDVHSENADDDSLYGIIRCGNVILESFSESSPQSPYVAGDTYGSSYNTTSDNFSGVGYATFHALCDASEISLGTVDPERSVKTTSTTIVGTLATWPDDCSLKSRLTITRKSAITGYTTIDYTTFNTATLPSGVTCASSIVCTHDPSKVLDRTLTYTDSGCVFHHNATVTTAGIFNVLEGVRSVCDGSGSARGWRNARDVELSSGVFAKGYYSQTSAPSTSSFPSADFTIGTGGGSEFTSVSTISAAPGSYRTVIETYSASGRLSSQLLGVGSDSSAFVLSNQWNFSAIIMAYEDGGINRSSFTVGVNMQFVSGRGLQNARGEALQNRNVECVRYQPNGVQNSASHMGLTSSSGHTPFVEFDVKVPIGVWRIQCSSSESGNVGAYNVTFQMASPFSGDTSLVLMTEVRPYGSCNYQFNGTFAVESLTLDSFNTTYVGVDPDTFIKVKIDQKNNFTQGATVLVPMTNLTQTGLWAYYQTCLDDIPGFFSDMNLHPIHVHAAANVTGRPFLATAVPTFINVAVLPNSVEIQTAIDPYIPLIVWGGLMLFWFYLVAWLPAIVSLMNLGNLLLPTPIWGLEASVMLFILATALHVLAMRGIIPAPWGRRN